MRYRVDEVAARCEVSVDTVRFYQARRLLPPPEREGRVVWYSDAHVERLLRIRDLKSRGFTLAMVAQVLGTDPPEGEDRTPVVEALSLALAGPLPGDDVPAGVDGALSLDDLAQRTGASVPLLEALEREGLLVGRVEGERSYTHADAEAVRAGLALLEAGVPLSELLAIARTHDRAMREVAEGAVDLFSRYVRDPARDSEASDEDLAAVLVDALRRMLPAAGAVVTHHFRRRLLAAAQERMQTALPAHEPDASASARSANE